MKRILVLAGLIALAGCSGSSGPVGENSPDSIKTTAEGKIVGTIPGPTPTPDAVETNAVDANLAEAAAATADDTSNQGE